ncbi:hypothetical protein P1J78_10640 [Psychromarinibacter sp. C21-152]|uniref:Uncharacterized protein n=1 Tax=Psychromarinibacter sediminicola TaxID=3033385 RepID=A0AAE3NSG7_9RHOB|nr:hypothetical protein [Psychromarinibacter sediminicola]MDF0601186.1 hypothetical protein [Psychromarinibacter sediminicola]
MTSRFALALLSLLLAAPALAQAVVDSSLSDLNGDGLRERFTLLHYPGADTVDLIVEDTGTGRVTARDIAWTGGIGQQPDIDVAPNGSIRLHSRNESIGRNRWVQTLTIAYRDGAYRVAGFTYEFYDTLNPDAAGSCDLNLLTGRGFVTRGPGPKKTIAHDVAARRVTDWRESDPIPEICRPWE